MESRVGDILDAADTLDASDAQPEAESHGVQQPSRPARQGAIMLRYCSSCRRGFKPLAMKARGSFPHCDKFCSEECSIKPVLPASTSVMSQPTPRAVLQRAKRQVTILEAKGVPAVFGARVASADGRSNHVIIAAQDPAVAVIMNSLLLGSAAGTTWTVPLQLLFAEACVNGRREGFQNYLASQLEHLVAASSAREITGAVLHVLLVGVNRVYTLFFRTALCREGACTRCARESQVRPFVPRRLVNL